MANDGNKKTTEAIEVLSDFDNLLTSIVIGNNIANIVVRLLRLIIHATVCGGIKGTTVSTFVHMVGYTETLFY